jgi:hypothetical protein
VRGQPTSGVLKSLSEHGVAVTGIERPPAMVAQLAAKPGAGAIDVTIGDMATASVDGDFGRMAQLAGLELDERWANWKHDPFTSESTAHVLVWRQR